MDEDELLYREMNEEDPWYMGDRPNEYEDDTDEEEALTQVCHIVPVFVALTRLYHVSLALLGTTDFSLSEWFVLVS